MKARKLIIAMVIMTLAFSALPNVFAQDEMAVESVCLVTDLGRINDGTFNQFAYEGMEKAVDEFDLDSTYIETQAETDYVANIDTCLQEGYDVVVTVGFLIADATKAAAEANPDVYFIGVDQSSSSKDDAGEIVPGPANYAGLGFREDQAGFLVGVLAALVSDSKIIAGVYGKETVPPVVRFRLGYEQGAAFVAAANGFEVKTLGVYIDDFVAPDKGASAANQFIGDGADVIFGAGGPTGTGGITAAAAQGVWVVGVDQDEYVSSFGNGETPGADKIISSAMKFVDRGVYDLIAALVNGDMEAFPGGSNYLASAENGGITFAPKHDADLDDGYYDYVTAIEALLADGTLTTGVDIDKLEISTTAADLVESVMDSLPEMSME